MTSTTVTGFQLSAQQEHLWMTHAAVPSHAYRTRACIDIAGALDLPRLETAITALALRSEILRATYPRLPGMTLPVQQVEDRPIHTIEMVDRIGCDGDGNGEDLAKSAWDTWQTHPANLTDPPSFQIQRLSPTRHLLLASFPALSVDAATLGDWFALLGAAYAAQGGHPFPADPEFHYIDFTAWQQQFATAVEAEPGRRFWQDQSYAARSATLPVPVPVASHFDPHLLSLPVSGDMATAITTLACQLDCDRTDLLLALWTVLLSRLTGEADVLIGVDCSGRHHLELASLWGVLTQSLPITASVVGAQPFPEFLAQVRLALVQGQQWQDCFSWERIASAHAIDLADRFCPFGFGVESHPAPYTQASVTFDLKFFWVCAERTLLKLRVREDPDHLTLDLIYDAARLQRADVERWGRDFQCLLDSTLQTPRDPIALLNSLGDRSQILTHFNPTPTDYPRDRCIHDLIAAVVAQYPHRIAVRSADASLTYGELDARSERLAAQLRSRGVGPEVRVGLCIERSPQMLVAILGILKAGGAYVPLDPAYPQERLDYLLNDACARWVLLPPHLLNRFPSLGERGLTMADDGCLMTEGLVDPIQTGLNAAPVGPHHLAYVIYTSGSTGRPKGVEIVHRNLVHSTVARIAVYPDSVERFLLLSSFAFDSSIAGIFWPLCQGGELYLVSPGQERDPAYLARIIAAERISHLLALPSLYQQILENAIAPFANLNTVIVAGETVPAPLLALHRQRCPHARIANEYGPTEGTVWSSVEIIEPSADLAAGSADEISIGRPIPNVQLYLLDADGQPVPLGAEGELYIGGEGVARGYLNQPTQTAERFVPNPFEGEGLAISEGSRLYRTGDRARYRPDGRLEFLGRGDRQVKLRGFRIELGEIETVLVSQPDVQRAIARLWKTPTGDAQLIAYAVAHPDSSPPADWPEHLRQGLRQKLPEVMVPARIIVLDDLPLTPNGKLDVNALPHPDDCPSHRNREIIAPRNRTEEKVADLWATLLRQPQVSVGDNFFDFGGHSLLATQLVANIREVFGVEISLLDFFEAPTLDRLALLIDQALLREIETDTVSAAIAEIESLSDTEIQTLLSREEA